ncbi:RagB/SusD family nutrient uptake outer membrane protein [Gaetbulibacter sp. M235]|uniref:RagB/SusD family nutrient uptake outer membrane protein n=1 Tax=Gaetbulibacter sp. M235 TaxID=3126510 RepID=UPI00374E62F7
MKNFKRKLFGLCVIMLSTVFSCQLTEDIDDFKPLYSLEAENAIVDETSAENALNGAYAKYSQIAFSTISRGLMSGDIIVGGYYNRFPEIEGWSLNNPPSNVDRFTLNDYSSMYSSINNCNWLLQEIAKLDASEFSTPERKDEIIGEAKLLRANTHFKLLQSFGQFYDMSSTFGIDVRFEPAISDKALPRKTVAETYAAILQDINDGIAMAPDLRGGVKGYVNKSFGKGLKAKILLYMGDYSEAASIATDLINTGGSNFALNPTHDGIFFPKNSQALFIHPEILFGIMGTPDAKSSLYIGPNIEGGFFGWDPYNVLTAVNGSMDVNGQSINFDGNRFETLFTPSSIYVPRKYSTNLSTETHEMWIQLRMAEVYLILAEADARANNAVTTVALNALNAVRTRAGATTTGTDGFETYPASISLDQFLKAVRIEKQIELYLETGESWFDLVRYDFIDGFGTGFQVSDVKPSATNPEKFILPIPIKSVEASGGVTVQNPSYE